MTHEAYVLEWVDAHRDDLSRDHATIWSYHEPGWREYRAARWYVERLRAEGFEVEAGSGGMPTAFAARWRSPCGDGPHIAAWAEYDAVPDNSQEPVPYRKPRVGVSELAAGFTEPHSAIGIGSLGAILAAKYAMEKGGLKGTLRFFGEPAENMCGGKPFHAAKGYYDGLDAAIAWRTAPLPVLANTCALETLCGCFWSRIYTFEPAEDQNVTLRTAGTALEAAATPQASARAPGALDALCLMYTTSKFLRDSMLPHTGSWSLNEAILANGSATADNLPARFAQIQYSWRCPSVDMAERILSVLDSNAEHVAGLTGTRWRGDWVSRTRPGLPNHALARIAYDHFERVGPPQWSEQARAFARACQQSLQIAPMADPFISGVERMTPPEKAEAAIRSTLPPWQTHYGTDDYVEYTWHAPTVRILVARPRLAAPEPGYIYPRWVSVACGGVPDLVDPVIVTAAKVIGSTIVDLLASPEKLALCKAEFELRTGGGIGGNRWLAPFFPSDAEPPVHHPWPEYVTTSRGQDWCLPSGA